MHLFGFLRKAYRRRRIGAGAYELTSLRAPRALRERGQSIIEILVVMSLLVIVGVGASVLVSGVFIGRLRTTEGAEALALAQEGIDAVRSIRDGAWNENTFTQSGVTISGGQWVFLGEGTDETIGQYTRTITFADICRDASDDITACPGTYTDVHIRQATVTVSWDVVPGVTTSVESVTYLTNWKTSEWLEDVTADFSDGTFSNTETSGVLGDGDGAVTLQAL